jgi:hypothetical protein
MSGTLTLRVGKVLELGAEEVHYHHTGVTRARCPCHLRPEVPQGPLEGDGC